jgi:hypothetical protein
MYPRRPSVDYLFQTPGPRQITVTVRNRRGETASRSFLHTVNVGSMNVTISAPPEGTTAFRKQPVYLSASGLTMTGAAPCDRLLWSVDRVPGWSARGCDVTATLDIAGTAMFTVQGKLDNGVSGKAQRQLVYGELPAKPTVTALSVTPEYGVRTREFKLRAVGSSPAGALTYRWSLVNPMHAGPPLELGTGAELTWNRPDDISRLCRALELEFQVTITDPNGQTETRSRTAQVDFGPC